MSDDLPVMKVILESALDSELPVNELTLSHHLYEDLGMDSMAAVVMVVEIQKRFGIRIADDDVPRLMTVGSVLDKVEALRRVRHA
ncbi:MAG TPA: acyl carrier protein [Nitrospira sp.]|nr:acyl carrier protein [Nitrospira sp.]